MVSAPGQEIDYLTSPAVAPEASSHKVPELRRVRFPAQAAGDTLPLVRELDSPGRSWRREAAERSCKDTAESTDMACTPAVIPSKVLQVDEGKDTWDMDRPHMHQEVVADKQRSHTRLLPAPTDRRVKER